MKKVLIVLFVLAVVSPVFAQEDPPEGPPPIAVAAHNQVIAFLDLGEDQVSAWDEIYRIHRDAEQPVKEELRILEAELKEMIDAGDPDPATVGNLVLQIADLKYELGEIHVIYHEDFMALLDEDQTRRLGFVARADRVQPIIPAFKLFELIRRR
ncbi:MAG: periplasmic heavy metal sensor [Acidobacteria bacterium]|nr:periplasmic heavy metal sensor [Acidobacteriota bacterium]